MSKRITGTVRQRGNSFQADFPNGSKPRLRPTFRAEGEAWAWVEEQRRRVALGLPPQLPNAATEDDHLWTLETLLKATRERHWRGTSNEGHAVRNATQVIEIIGKHKHPRDVVTADVDRLLIKLTEPDESGKPRYAGATVNRKLASLKKMLTFAQKRGLVDKPPVIEKLREPEGRIRWYTPEEEVGILKACEELRLTDLHDLIVFLADTGCRIGEALRVEWRDADDPVEGLPLQDRRIRFHKTKNDRRRAVPQTRRVQAMLAERRTRQQSNTGPTDLIFAGWDRMRADKAWRRVRTAAGLDQTGATIHAFRHTCCSRMISGGIPLPLVQQWMGHQDLKTTLRYSHLLPMNWSAAVDLLDSIRDRVPTAPKSGEAA